MSQGVVERPIAAERLPLALRAYRLATLAGSPLAGFLLSSRLKRGKEDPARLDERRGEATIARPDGPLIWIHGASVGEVAAIIPLIERIVAKEFNVLLTSGTVTSAKLAGQWLPPGVIHQYVPLDAPRFARASSIIGSPTSACSRSPISGRT